MTIEQCYECRYATEYLAWYWYPFLEPTCQLGNPMHVDQECENFIRIGRGSR